MAHAAISNVQVVATTNVQAILSYEAPTATGPCRLKLSEKASFEPAVHDVNPALFPGADQDTGAGSLLSGTTRIFVVGKRAVDRGSDGKWYSRALQADAPHFYRIVCGADTVTGAFKTANIPVGSTYPWPIPQDPETGQFRWPSTDNNNRNQTIIDPNYGTLIRRVTVPGDAPSGINAQHGWRNQPFQQAKGTNWTNPAESLSDGGGAATYSGSGQDWLIATNPGISSSVSYEYATAVDWVTVRLKASSTGVTPEQRTIEACLTIDGATCHSQLRSVVLEQQEKTYTIGKETPIDTWGETLFHHDVNDFDRTGNKNFGVMIRPRTASVATLSIQYVDMGLAMSEMAGQQEAGNFRVCHPTESNGGFHCSVMGSGGNAANYMFWIRPETGEVRWLGKIVATGWGGGNVQCVSSNALWDSTDPNVYYCSTRINDKAHLLKGTYRGNDAPAQPGEPAAMTWEDLTPEPSTISDLIKAFQPAFDPLAYRCGLGEVVNQYAVFLCRRAGQDTIGWIALFDLANKKPLDRGGTGRVIAAASSFGSPNARWCSLHSVEPMGDINWIGWTPQVLTLNREGGGPYAVTLQSSLPAATGSFTVQVSGEPVPYLQDMAPGDVFRFKDSRYDLLRIVQKKSPTEWVVERLVSFMQPIARSAGETLHAWCSLRSLQDPTVTNTLYWNFLADPKAQDTTNSAWVVERVLTGAHIVQRGNYRLQAGYPVVTPGAPQSWNHPISFNIPLFPSWRGKVVGRGVWQSHPSYENYKATGAGRNNWFVDLIPFIGAADPASAVTLVSGTQQVYKAAGVKINRDLVPTFAYCGGRQLKDITPGPIQDSDSYRYCVGAACVSGAAKDDVFVNCPAPVSSTSKCTGNFEGDAASVCVADLVPYGQSVTQFFFDPSGLRTRVLTNGLFPWHAPRTQMILSTATPLPDGSWVLFQSFGNNARRDVYMVKVPPQPEFQPDAQAHAREVPVEVTVTPPPGTAQVTLEYGADPGLAYNTAKACTGGQSCSITVYATPLTPFYSRTVYRNSSGAEIGRSTTGVRFTTGVAGAGLEKPKLKAAGIVNAASFDTNIAPGGIVTIYGENLSLCTEGAVVLPLPTSLCGTSATFNGIPAPLFYSGWAGGDPDSGYDQLNVVLPAAVSPDGDAQLVVTSGFAPSDPVLIPASAIKLVAPAMYAYALEDQVPRAVIQNSDWSLNGPLREDLGTRPLRFDETAVVYANALGPTSPAVQDGHPAPAVEPLARTASGVEVYVNDVSQPVAYSGLAPNFAALYQVNFTLARETPVKPEGQNYVWLRVNGLESPRLLISLAGA